jgi:hypothetical protein
LDTHDKSEGSETPPFLLLENGLREKSQNNLESVKKDVSYLEKSLKNDMDWSDHFETHKLDMLLESDEDKNKKIFIKNCEANGSIKMVNLLIFMRFF